MDDYDFDGDIADEDLMMAVDQPPQNEKPVLSTQKWTHRVPATSSKSYVNSAGRGGGSQSTARGGFGVAKTPSRNASCPGRMQPAGEYDLQDLPSDAFDSDTSPVNPDASNELQLRNSSSSGRMLQRSASGTQSFRQTTLWGQTVQAEASTQSQPRANYAYRADLPPEVPSHHELDRDALRTWVYPTNLAPIRDYQFSIVKNGLFHNTLVALPTGLGKTFIAATVMLNFFRWTKSAKIVFVAPTKPLVSQQVEACLGVTGIPRSEATLLTGETPPALREDEWSSKRLFFMTPQTLQNDLGKGYADPKSITLLVIDEAHKATGNYAYVHVVEFLRRFNKSFRVLALTATPGSTVEGVQEVIDNLGISHIEIRTEQSLDIRQYVHSRGIEETVIEPSDEILHIRELFSKALKPIVDKLSGQNIWYGRDPMDMTAFGLMQRQQEWMQSRGRHVNQGVKFMVQAVFRILCSLAHSIKLLNFHGIAPFYHNLVEFRNDTEGKGEKGSKYKRQIVQDENFVEMMDTVGKWMKTEGFVGHPKLTYLCDTLLNHFMDAGEGSSTRAIVFSEYRDSAEEIVRILNQHKPLISASVFVGQADSKNSGGMKQAQQIETIQQFRNGKFNVLVATSIGEEGLDIGQVDLIICYDASASPIRMLQRMGRTGRKRAGNIVLLLMQGKEEEKFRAAKDNYEKMQIKICAGTEFNFRHDLSARIVPRDIKPEVDKRMVEIPIENSQDAGLPEPKKSRSTKKKASKKVFHMPDGVETGFMKASSFGRPAGTSSKQRPVEPSETDSLADIPSLESVTLNHWQNNELRRLYSHVPLGSSNEEEIAAPDLNSFPRSQRELSTTFTLKHGTYTKRCVRLFQKLAAFQATADRYKRPYGEADGSRYKALPVRAFADEVVESEPEDELPVIAEGSRKRVRTMPKPYAKKRKSGTSGRRSTNTQKNAPSFVDTCEADDVDESAEEDVDGSPDPPKRGRGRPKKAGRGRPAQRTRNANNLEEVGDDCTRTSQLYESDGSDSGGDLVGFIVDDDAVTSSVRHRSTSPTSTSLPPSSLDPNRTQSEKPFYVPIPMTQDSGDDEMPSMSQLTGNKPDRAKTGPRPKRPSGPYVDSDESDADVHHRPAPRKKSKRTVFDDSESD